MAILLHMSNDYPDVLATAKTKAVANLIGGIPEHRHVIYSLNRINGISGIESFPSGNDCTAVVYGALPKGLFWHGRLNALAAWILADLRAKNMVPDVIHAHKLTVEGVIGHILAKALNRPLICDIRGDSDSKIYKNKPAMQGLYKQILQDAAVIFARAPWTIDAFEKIAGLDRRKSYPLPVIPGVLELSPAEPVQEEALISVFHLDTWRRKNLLDMAKAANILKQRRPNIHLDVYGAGSPKTIMQLRHRLRSADPAGCIRLKGPVKHEQMKGLMKNYAGLVLPSTRESYGMVYAEALFNGLPVLFSKDWGIDGYFETSAIGYACNPHSISDIAEGMEYLLAHQTRLKQRIAEMQKAGQLSIIQKDAILATYRRGIESALSRA